MKTRKAKGKTAGGRKLLCLVMLLAVAASALPAAVSADPPAGGSGHRHRWEKLYEADATCTEEGYIIYECSEEGCQDTPYREVTSPALGHAWNGGQVTRQPSCTEDGVRTYTCTRCGATTTEGIPATGHTPEVIPGKGATCEEEGLTDGQKCAVCGQILVAQERMEPMGHRWDAGKMVKEPGNLSEDGEMLYTCLYDPSHTKTETVSAASAMFSKLRFLPKNPPKPKGEGTLEITLQPEGSSVMRFGPGKTGHTFTVEVTGGKEPYTYEWHAVDEEKAAAVEQNLVPDGFTGAADRLVTIIAQAGKDKTAAHTGFTTEWKHIFGEAENVQLPEVPMSGDVEIARFSPYDKVVSHDARLTTTGGGKTYYCIITDDNGDWVETDHVALPYGVSISKQPENCNIYLSSEAPNIKVCDGRRPYSYEWFLLEDGQPVPTEDHDDTLNAKQSGDYYCVVTDDTGDSVQSKTVSMYAAPPLGIVGTSRSADNIIDLKETVDLNVYVSGGVPPYSAHFESWTDGWVDVEAEEYSGDEYEADYCFSTTVDEADTYEFIITDAKGMTNSVMIGLPYNQLEVKQQPVARSIEGKFTRMLEMEMAEGEFPLTYELYRIDSRWDEDAYLDGELVDTYTDESYVRKIEVEDPGLYYFIVTDSTGRWARTEAVRADVQYLWVYANTDYVEVKDDSKAVTLQVKVCGTGVTGIDSVTFDWYRIDNYTRKWTYLDEEDPYVAVIHNVNYFTEGEYTGLENRIDITRPGFYICEATDASGHVTYSQSLRVNYINPEPYFTVQPASVTIPGTTSAHPETTLTCEAVSSDERRQGEEYKGDIVYSWEKYLYGFWRPIYVSSASTNTLHLVQEDEGAIDNTDTVKTISGRYRCKATETSTGWFRYSNTAVVRHSLEFEFYSARINRDGSANITWEYMGGFRPHNIRIFTSKWRCVDKKKDVWERWTEEYPLKDGWYDLEEEEGRVMLTLYSVPTLTRYGGKDNPHYDPMHYTIRVDSAGETRFHRVDFTLEGRTSGTEYGLDGQEGE